MIDYEHIVDSMLFEARVAMLDGYILEVESCQFSDCITHVMEKLRQAEKDAARYRWLMAQGGILLEPAVNRTHLYIPNYCPPSIDYVDVSKHIDEAMQCQM